MVKETWLPVVGFEGIYEVSDLGKVKSLARVVSASNREVNYTEKILRTETLKRGYQRVCLCDHTKRVKKLVHVLVAEAFIGPRPIDMEVCHNNGDGSDNSLSNIRWDTRTSNTRDRIRHGTHNWLESKGGVIPDNYYDKGDH